MNKSASKSYKLTLNMYFKDLQDKINKRKIVCVSDRIPSRSDGTDMK